MQNTEDHKMDDMKTSVNSLADGIASEILEWSSTGWSLRENHTLNQKNFNGEQISDSDWPDKCYIFIDLKSYPETEEFRKQLLKSFDVPDILTTKTCTAMNGYFGSRSHYNEDDVERHGTWFRCLIKMIPKVNLDSKGSQVEPADDDLPDNEEGKGYRWYEMGFFTQWHKSGRCRVMCIDTPTKLQQGLLKALQNLSTEVDFHDPFALHAHLLDQIILLYDTSVWRVRDPVRKVEKARENIKKERAKRKKRGDDESVDGNRLFPIPDFGTLHEISRHAIHVSEILSVTIETLRRLQSQQKVVYKHLPKGFLVRTYKEQAQEYLGFQLQLIESLKARSVANHDRLKNEIELAYTVLVLQDSEVMKTVALLTMILLPATFLATFFSTTFFTFGETGWRVSTSIWIYIVIAVPATLIILCIWHFWLYGPGKARGIWEKYIGRPWEKSFGGIRKKYLARNRTVAPQDSC